MTEYITQEQAVVLWGKTAPEFADGRGFDAALSAFTNAAIQAYRDSLADGVVLPVSVGFVDHGGVVYWHNGRNNPPPDDTQIYTADQLRQAIADALAKQVQLEPVNCDTCRYHHKEADQTPCNTCIHIRDFGSNFEPRFEITKGQQ